MDLGITGRVALVVGASRGLGRATADLLADEGARVVVAARDEARIDATVRGITGRGGQAVGVRADVTVPSDVARAVEVARSHFGPPDIVVSSVRPPADTAFSRATDAEFRATFEVLVIGIANLVRETVPDMKRRGWGRIVVIGSGSAKEPPPELDHILGNTVRASAVTLCKSLANELGPHGITVNTLGTGLFRTPDGSTGKVIEAALGGSREEALAAWCEKVPMRRPGRPEEMAGICAFLCSDLGGYITGQMVMVDGGFGRSAW